MQPAPDVAIGVDIPTSPVAAVVSTITSSLASATAAAVMASTTAESSPQGPLTLDASPGECQLLGSFALIVQAALGSLALLSLVYKRWKEHPQRPIKIWFFDASKQVFGSVLVHISNIFMSMLTSGRFSIKVEPAVQRLMRRDDDGYVPNPCSFYLLNLAIDTTVGIPILILLLRVFTFLATLTPMGRPKDSVRSGYYGNPPNVLWWLKQSIIYFAGLFGMKLCVLVIFIMMPWISQVGDWALGWTDGNERLQVAFVMMIFPLIMNGLQYYIIDSFIKEKDTTGHERLPSDDPDEGMRIFDGTLHSAVDDVSDEEAEEDLSKHAEQESTILDEEYDPAVDRRTPIVFSSSSS